MTAAPEPAALALRRAEPTDAPAIATLHVACWREAYAGLLPDRELDALSVRERTFMWARMLTDRGHAAAARSASAPAVRSEAARSQPPVSTARSRPSTCSPRRSAPASAPRALAGDLAAAGRAGMALWVLHDNRPARRFYEHLGGRRLAERTERARDGSLNEVTYGWRDLSALISE